MLSNKYSLYKALFLRLLLVTLMAWGQPVFSERYNFVDVNVHPLGFYDEQHRVKGVAIDIFKQVMSNLGHDVSFQLLPGNRVIHLLKEGKTHGVPFIRKTDSRKEFLDYSKEIIISEDIYLYINKGKEFTFNGNLDALKNKKIAIVLGDTHGEKFNSISVSLDIVETSNVASSFKMLEKQRVDIVLSTTIRASKELKNERSHLFVKLPNPLVTVSLYAAFSKTKNLNKLRDQFDKELKNIKNSGEVDRIIEKWH